MVGTLLVRGMLVGIVAGLLSFGFLKIYGEPQVDRAIAFETAHSEVRTSPQSAGEHSHGHEHAAEHVHAHAADDEEPELVSRAVQAGLGLFVAALVYSVAFGGLFGLAYAFAIGRVPAALSPRGLAALLATAGFIAIYLVPNLKFPANPPSVGEPDTIGVRTALYFIMIAISLAAMILSAAMKNRLLPRFGEWNANLLIAASYIVIVGIVALLLPVVNEVPEGFPATLLWNFRIASIGSQLIMWATFGLLFGAFAQGDAVKGAQEISEP